MAGMFVLAWTVTSVPSIASTVPPSTLARARNLGVAGNSRSWRSTVIVGAGRTLR